MNSPELDWLLKVAAAEEGATPMAQGGHRFDDRGPNFFQRVGQIFVMTLVLFLALLVGVSAVIGSTRLARMILPEEAETLAVIQNVGYAMMGLSVLVALSIQVLSLVRQASELLGEQLPSHRQPAA